MISILMASYNGERYIGQQIESLLAQTEQGFRLIIQDDCSADGTAAVAQGYADRFPGRIHVAKNRTNSGSSANNFLNLIASHADDYVMLCDQDDVWLPSKIARSMEAMRALEAGCGKSAPLLVHGALAVVDEELRPVGPFDRMLGIDPMRTGLNRLLAQNVLTGCTMLYNRALAELAQGRVHSGAIIHDWWLGLVAAAFGRIGYVDEPLILYRQHAGNAIGAKDARKLRYKASRALDEHSAKDVLAQTYRQAEGFLRAYGDILPPAQRSLAERYAKIPSIRSKPGRALAAARLGTLKHGTARLLGQLWYI